MKKLATLATMGLAAATATAVFALPIDGAVAASTNTVSTRQGGHGADDGADHDAGDDHGGDRPDGVSDDDPATHESGEADGVHRHRNRHRNRHRGGRADGAVRHHGVRGNDAATDDRSADDHGNDGNDGNHGNRRGSSHG